MSNTLFTDSNTAMLAFSLAHGRYQRGLAGGLQKWSGGDLKGKARRWGAKYRASRGALLQRWGTAGIHVEEVTGPRGLRVKVLSFPTKWVVEGVNSWRRLRALYREAGFVTKRIGPGKWLVDLPPEKNS